MPRYPRSYGGLSQTKNVKLKWAYEWVGQGWTGQTKQDWVFYPNGLWDPFQGTQSSIQPRYFDQYCTPNGGSGMYANYIVRGCKFEIVIQNLTPVPLVGATTVWGSPVVDIRPTTYIEALSRGDCRCFRVGPADSSNGLVKLKQFVNVQHALNIKDQLDDSGCWGSGSANPTDLAHLGMRIWNDYGGVAASATVAVTMVFYCRFFNLNDIPTSTMDTLEDDEAPYSTDTALTADGQVTFQPAQDIAQDPIAPLAKKVKV